MYRKTEGTYGENQEYRSNAQLYRELKRLSGEISELSALIRAVKKKQEEGERL